MTTQEMKVQKNKTQILKYISKKAFNIGSRELAIKKAIKNAEPKEIIWLLAKDTKLNRFTRTEL